MPPIRLRPLIPFPALMLENDGRILVVADLHMGWERSWAESGIYIPSQAGKLTRKLVNILEKYAPDRVILLGDVKQAITRMGVEEWREIPNFFQTIQEHVDEVTVILGNHDGELEPLTPSTVTIVPASGLVIGKHPSIGLFHGHAWPAPQVLASEILIMGHIHPVVWFRDRLGLWTVRPVWVKTRCRGETIARAYLKYLKGQPRGNPVAALKERAGIEMGDATLIIVPAFNDLVGGVSMNRLETRLLGPLLRSRGVDLEEAEVYLTDGTFLGTISQLQQHLSDSARRQDDHEHQDS
jgi:putative SbcD/Mre11-related phosphoesterase